ncbi:hypothetical protein CANCADRAFT_58578 [Tortispora caseinolytica NRRL Y-17796]|uniref:Uncharacterized protein n=1 Tax=Tortispora caseinolytica NRRL Y-17796 TaxID=767744 RepID=A0A1E4TDA0_9ASCO|nr:hypothetical protein CANCADRAFT_58578 [Tortispora caseinolytica NRRL Y-17796]
MSPLGHSMASTESIQRRIEKVKADNAILSQKLNEQRQQVCDTSLPNVAAAENIAPLANMKFRRRQTLEGHFGKIYATSWSYDWRHLVSASQDGQMIIWDAFTGYKRSIIPLRSSWVMTCAFAPSGNFVAAGGLDNICSLYSTRLPEDVREGKPAPLMVTKELSHHQGYLSCCEFISDQKLITGSGDMTCVLWDVEKAQPITIFSESLGDVIDLAVSPTSSHVFVSGGCDRAARVWDSRVGASCVQIFSGYHTDDINAISFAPNGLSFTTGSDDASCRLFDMRVDTQMSMYSSTTITSGISSIAMSRSGRVLFAGYNDSTVRVWDVLYGSHISTIQGHTNKVSAVAVSRDGASLSTASWDSTVQIWTV